jgi:hypothetical protein
MPRRQIEHGNILKTPARSDDQPAANAAADVDDRDVGTAPACTINSSEGAGLC